jgi:hypothetical protein
MNHPFYSSEELRFEPTDERGNFDLMSFFLHVQQLPYDCTLKRAEVLVYIGLLIS